MPSCEMVKASVGRKRPAAGSVIFSDVSTSHLDQTSYVIAPTAGIEEDNSLGGLVEKARQPGVTMSSCSVNQPRQNTKSGISSRQNSQEPLAESHLIDQTERLVETNIEENCLDNSSNLMVPNTMPQVAAGPISGPGPNLRAAQTHREASLSGQDGFSSILTNFQHVLSSFREEGHQATAKQRLCQSTRSNAAHLMQDHGR